MIHNCPDLSDVSATLDILRLLGCRVEREEDTVTIDASGLNRCLQIIWIWSILCKRGGFGYPAQKETLSLRRGYFIIFRKGCPTGDLWGRKL